MTVEQILRSRFAADAEGHTTFERFAITRYDQYCVWTLSFDGVPKSMADYMATSLEGHEVAEDVA